MFVPLVCIYVIILSSSHLNKVHKIVALDIFWGLTEVTTYILLLGRMTT